MVRVAQAPRGNDSLQRGFLKAPRGHAPNSTSVPMIIANRNFGGVFILSDHHPGLNFVHELRAED